MDISEKSIVETSGEAGVTGAASVIAFSRFRGAGAAEAFAAGAGEVEAEVAAVAPPGVAEAEEVEGSAPEPDGVAGTDSFALAIPSSRNC